MQVILFYLNFAVIALLSVNFINFSIKSFIAMLVSMKLVTLVLPLKISHVILI